MGSLDHKSKVTFTGLETEDETTGNADGSIVYTPLAYDEYSRFNSENRIYSFASCSSSISIDSSLEDLPQDSDDEQDNLSLKLDGNAQLATKHDKQASDSGTPTFPPRLAANNDPIAGSPPIQVMERNTTSKYRIPSHVFARKKPAPREWSNGSNDSLFSIQTGGNSFCNQDGFTKSGEPGLSSGAEATGSSKPFNPPYNSQPLGGKSSESDKTGKRRELREADKVHELGKGSNGQGSSMPSEPMNLDSKEDQRSTADQRTSRSSDSSSAKSFVFPVLAGEPDKCNSPNPRGSLTEVPEEPTPQSPSKPAPAPAQAQAPAPAPESPSKPEASASASETKAETKKKKAFPSIAWTKWFPCFRACTCCTCCS